MHCEIRTIVSHSQLAIFAKNIENPFNDWTERHALQGFSWRPGSVSFRTIAESGEHIIDVLVCDQLPHPMPEAVHAIEVPFDVPPNGGVEVGSIIETTPVPLKGGAYLLRCEFLQPRGEIGTRGRLTFARAESPRFFVVRADSELSVGHELLKTAKPAVS
ncbi:competence protein ComJ [Oryzibacter oryziterrae]|uniref:competence protein ComJ n=1 Tax=Oryzibacter oryziterrae TaxID=2766474 RepID=UPI0036F2C39E